MIIISLGLIITFFTNLNFSKIFCLNFENIFKNNFKLLDKFTIHNCEDKCSKDQDVIEDQKNKEHFSEAYGKLFKIKQIFFLFTFVNFIFNFILVIFFAHTQIINRVLTTNPLLYFFCCEKVYEYKIKNSKSGKFILIIFISYSIIGCVMQPGGYGFA